MISNLLATEVATESPDTNGLLPVQKSILSAPFLWQIKGELYDLITDGQPPKTSRQQFGNIKRREN